MVTNDLSEIFAIALEPELQDIPMFAKNLELGLRAIWASVARNEEEQKAIAEAEQNFNYSITRDGSSFQLRKEEAEELPVEKLLEEGKDIPYTGGQGGFVTHLDGTKTKSMVPAQLQGKPIPEFAWDPMPVEQEAKTILSDTVPEMISSYASNSSAGQEAIKQELLSKFQLGSDS